MIRAALIRAALATAAALPLLGAAKPEVVDYRLAFDAAAGEGLTVELRLRGDADGETRLDVPAGLASDLAVSGAAMQTPDATHRVLRHKPGAKLTIRYRVRSPAGGLSALGEQLFVRPEGREAQAATVRWDRLPQGWRVVSDLEPSATGRPLTVAEVGQSVILAGANVQVAEAALPNSGGTLRAAQLGGDLAAAQKLADAAAPAIAAERAWWGDETGPFLVVRTAAADHPIERGDAVALPTAGISDAGLKRAVAAAHLAAWIPGRVGRPPIPAWYAEGFSDFLTDRILLKAGQISLDNAVGRLAEADRGRDAAARGAILALKWDEAVRLKTGGKADLDDVILQMRNHYRQFAPGQGPDLTTGLVSAVWVVAKLDIRPEIARYAEGPAPIDLPEEMFGGCLQGRVTVAPAFDAGFNADASFAAKRLTGVRPRGPAWNSGLRDGMTLVSWTYTPGDMTRQIELVVLPTAKGKALARGKPRKVVFWPYGDADTNTRKIQLQPVLTAAQLKACVGKVAGA